MDDHVKLTESMVSITIYAVAYAAAIPFAQAMEMAYKQVREVQPAEEYSYERETLSIDRVTGVPSWWSDLTGGD